MCEGFAPDNALKAIGAVVGSGLNIAAQLQSGQDFDVGKAIAATATGALGGGLGTVTRGLSWGKNIITNAIGSGAIGAGVTRAKNQITGSCDDVKAATINGFLAGGIGAGIGNMTSNAIASINRGHYENLPLNVRLFFESNAMHGVNKPIVVPGGVTLSNASSNTIANMTVYKEE